MKRLHTDALTMKLMLVFSAGSSNLCSSVYETNWKRMCAIVQWIGYNLQDCLRMKLNTMLHTQTIAVDWNNDERTRPWVAEMFNLFAILISKFMLVFFLELNLLEHVFYICYPHIITYSVGSIVNKRPSKQLVRTHRKREHKRITCSQFPLHSWATERNKCI